MLELETVAASERETVRVFAVDLAPDAAKAWVEVHSNLEAALGAPLNADHLESFPAEDLSGMGLAQFLIEGYGIAEADIAPERTALDTAGPQLVLIRARAFGEEGAALSPRPPLIPLGVFAQAGTPLPGATPHGPLAPGAVGQVPPHAVAPSPKGPLIAVLIFLALAIALMAALIVPKL